MESRFLIERIEDLIDDLKLAKAERLIAELSHENQFLAEEFGAIVGIVKDLDESSFATLKRLSEKNKLSHRGYRFWGEYTEDKSILNTVFEKSIQLAPELEMDTLSIWAVRCVDFQMFDQAEIVVNRYKEQLEPEELVGGYCWLEWQMALFAHDYDLSVEIFSNLVTIYERDKELFDEEYRAYLCVQIAKYYMQIQNDQETGNYWAQLALDNVSDYPDAIDFLEASQDPIKNRLKVGPFQRGKLHVIEEFLRKSAVDYSVELTEQEDGGHIFFVRARDEYKVALDFIQAEYAMKLN